jgi:hypothetical protein
MSKDSTEVFERNVTQVVRIKKLKGSSAIGTAARHNLRQFDPSRTAPSHIDATRSGMNLVLRGERCAAAVEDAAKLLKSNAGITKLRKNAVVSVELLVSLPPDTGIDLVHFFNDAVAWAVAFFRVPVLSAVVHLDEAAPHMHVILLPLIDGKLQGSQLVGYKSRLRAMHEDFDDKVGAAHGLLPIERRRRMSAATKRAATAQIVDAIVNNPSLLHGNRLQNALSNAIGAGDLHPILDILDLKLPEQSAPKKQTFAAVMTRPVACRPD